MEELLRFSIPGYFFLMGWVWVLPEAKFDTAYGIIFLVLGPLIGYILHSFHMFWHERCFNYSEKRMCIGEIIKRAKEEMIEVNGFQAFLAWDYWVHSLEKEKEALRLHDVRIWQIVHSFETVYLCSFVNFIIFGLMLMYKFFKKSTFESRYFCAVLIYLVFAIFFYLKNKYGTKKHLMEFEKKMVEQNWDSIKGNLKR